MNFRDVHKLFCALFGIYRKYIATESSTKWNDLIAETNKLNDDFKSAELAQDMIFAVLDELGRKEVNNG